MTQIPVATKSDAETGIPLVTELSRRLDAVREKAFERFQRRGGSVGSELEDWFGAERDVLGWPAAEVKERDGGYEIKVTLAGFSPADIDVVADSDAVIVRAASQRSASGADESVVWSEFGSNEVFRRLPLPELIDAERVNARYDNGLLRIHAPKAATKDSTAVKP